MEQNYTPLDLGRFISASVTTSQSVASAITENPKSKDKFDKLFFPASLSVFILALSLYAFKFYTENATTASLAKVKDAPVVTMTSSPTPSPTPVKLTSPSDLKEIPSVINDITIEKDKLASSASKIYPNMKEDEIILNVNRDLVEWATLKKYYDTDPVVLGKLKSETYIDSLEPIISDLNILKMEYDKKGVTQTNKTLTDMVAEFLSMAVIK